MTEPGAAVPAATSSLDVRQDLVDALKVDLVGPGAGHELAHERLPIYESPSNWYLTGFLIPSDTPPELGAGADEDDDDLDEVPERAGLAEESTEDRKGSEEGVLSVIDRAELPGCGHDASDHRALGRLRGH